MIIFRFLLANERKPKQIEQLKESYTRQGWKQTVNFQQTSSKNISLCSFTQEEKMHPNRCSCDVGTFIWSHQKNHKRKHIFFSIEKCVLKPMILLWWPKAIFDSIYWIIIQHLRVSNAGVCGEGSLVCPIGFLRKWEYTRSVPGFLSEYWLCLITNQGNSINSEGMCTFICLTGWCLVVFIIA